MGAANYSDVVRRAARWIRIPSACGYPAKRGGDGPKMATADPPPQAVALLMCAWVMALTFARAPRSASIKSSPRSKPVA